MILKFGCCTNNTEQANGSKRFRDKVLTTKKDQSLHCTVGTDQGQGLYFDYGSQVKTQVHHRRNIAKPSSWLIASNWLLWLVAFCTGGGMFCSEPDCLVTY